MVNQKALHHAKKAASAIVLQKNVGAAALSGNPAAVGTALASNAVGYGLKHVNFKKLGLKNPSAGKVIKGVGAVAQRAMDYKSGKAALINKGDLKIGAKWGANHLLKGKDRSVAKEGIKVLSGKKPLTAKFAAKAGNQVFSKAKRLGLKF